MNTIEDLANVLSGWGARIYLSHYEDAQPARWLAKQLEQRGFQVTVAEDARRLGPDFVSKCIADSDVTLVIDPESSEEHLIMNAGGVVLNVTRDEKQ